MKVYNHHYKQTKTTNFFKQLNKFVFIFGLPSYWIEDLDFPNKFYGVYRHINTIGNMCICILIFSEIGAFFTQKNLTDEQFTNLMFYTAAHATIFSFRIRMASQVTDIRNVIYNLGVKLKERYNDVEVEEAMIKKSKFYSGALAINCSASLVLITLEACMATIYSGKPFNTLITVIPDVDDVSAISNIFRVIYYIFWWIFVTRVFSVYTLVICLTTTMSHQFKNLSSYFWSLGSIFEKDNLQTTREQEQMYEAGLKIGIEMHAETLKCVYQIQKICREVFSGQIIFNLILLLAPMYQLVNSDRNLADTITIVVTAATILLSTGIFMWNAGDVTVEAATIPNSIFSSGWENCRNDCSKRIRTLIVISTMQAQQPVVLTGFGIIALSYQSYVSIVKSSYSIFSVLY